MKFGGTSMAGIERIRHVASLVKREADRGNDVAVVVSGDPFDFRDLATRIERVYQDGRLVVGAAPEPVAAAV